MTANLKLNDQGILCQGNTSAFFAENIDEILSHHSVDGEILTSQTFRTNFQKTFDAQNCFEKLENGVTRELISSGRNKDYSHVLENLKSYYEQGRNAMLSLGVAIRTSTNDGTHLYVLKADDAVIDNAIYQEKKHQSQFPEDYPNRTRNIETPKGDALVVVSEFFEAKEHLKRFNQFQMIHHMKNSVCAAHWALERYHVDGFERINKAPKLGLPL